jgi:hypothetical protein
MRRDRGVLPARTGPRCTATGAGTGSSTCRIPTVRYLVNVDTYYTVWDDDAVGQS